MQELFLELVKLSLTGSLLALAVMLVRLVFHKAPKWIFCLLWGLVGLRLILPISIESELSLVPERLASGQVITDVGDHYVGDVAIIYESSTDYSNAVQSGRQPIYSNNTYYVVTEKDSYDAPPTVEETVYPLSCGIWLTGMALMLTYTVASYLILKRKMDEATLVRENIWQCEQVDSPFVLGMIWPKIYLPYQISESDMQNVIAHEQAHIRRKDHWWKPIGFLLLCVHWFNPVMWLAYVLLSRDIEAACDEKVIKHMSKGEIRAYSTSLLNCSVHRNRIAACPLAFGETGVKERIKHVMNYRKPAFWIIILAVAASITVGVLLLTDPVSDSKGDITLIEESYEYSVERENYVQPATVEGWAEKDALMTTTEDGSFFCFTADTAQADDFINAQRTLLRYLKDQGMEIREMEFYCTDYGYCFSESSGNAAYIDRSSVRTWQQVLVTLQGVWGDYTDYGYVYAMSNAIAGELDWQTEAAPSMDKGSLDAFFTENPAAVHLLYPTFTARFSSEETVNNSKALVSRIFARIDWRTALAKPIEEQLDDYYSLVGDYAEELSVPFARQVCGYAYYGENVPLRIMTEYAELIVDGNYKDVSQDIYGDYFSDYVSIYETANIINRDITASVARFGLEDEAGMMTIKFLDSEEPSTKKYVQRLGRYYFSTETAYVTSLFLCLHEYHEHIENILTQGSGFDWQPVAFCVIGSTYSQHYLYSYDYSFTQDQKCTDLFYTFTGRSYQPGRDDFYEVMDILCYVNDYYLLGGTGAQSLASISRYLIDRYGEEAVCGLMLFPETVEDVTGKSWEELESEWEQHIRNKYAGIEIPPDWIGT